MNIVYHCTDLFAPITGVSIISIFENNKEAENIAVYIFENKVSDSNKLKLKQITVQYSREIFFMPMPNIQEDYKFPITQIKKKWLFDSYSRLFLGSLLPHLDQVLYLDADTICTGNLNELWNMNMNNNYFASVIDCLGESYYKHFEMNDDSYYFNSGMMLINLKKWRENNIENLISDFVRAKNGYVFFMEQSVMNIVLQGKVQILHPKYNVYSLMPVFSYKNLKLLRHCKRYYTKHEINEAIASPKIIHFTSTFYLSNRPWYKENNHPFKELFLKYRSLTPWCNDDLFSEKKQMKVGIKYFLINTLPQNMISFSAGIIYNYLRPLNIRQQEKKLSKKNDKY